MVSCRLITKISTDITKISTDITTISADITKISSDITNQDLSPALSRTNYGC